MHIFTISTVYVNWSDCFSPLAVRWSDCLFLFLAGTSCAVRRVTYKAWLTGRERGSSQDKYSWRNSSVTTRSIDRHYIIYLVSYGMYNTVHILNLCCKYFSNLFDFLPHVTQFCACEVTSNIKIHASLYHLL